VREVLGIDLQSENQDILIMDMHAMTFPSESFDLVYSSHSLEHAHDPQQAVKEFLRVVRPGGVIAVEVPVDYDKENPTSDLYDFETLDNLLRLFNDYIARVLWQETDRPLDAGNDVLRVIMQVKK
jgi:ubiquinone/menaquinone biosynthesis C-methylase UbiE